MNQDEEKRQFHEWLAGLRRYIKEVSQGKFAGNMLAPNWSELPEQQQDQLISEAFVLHAVWLTQEAHDAIHGKKERTIGRPNRRRR